MKGPFIFQAVAFVGAQLYGYGRAPGRKRSPYFGGRIENDQPTRDGRWFDHYVFAYSQARALANLAERRAAHRKN